MDKNGRNSCTGKYRHISVRYVFMKEWIDKGTLRVKYFPTHLMLEDYFMNPLMGKMFKELEDAVIG